jgi:hypothetical protein
MPHGDAAYTSHVTRHTSHVTRHTSHVTRHTSHVPGHARQHRPIVLIMRTHHEYSAIRKQGEVMSHVTRHTSHVTRHTSHITRHTSHVPASHVVVSGEGAAEGCPTAVAGSRPAGCCACWPQGCCRGGGGLGGFGGQEVCQPVGRWWPCGGGGGQVG